MAPSRHSEHEEKAAPSVVIFMQADPKFEAKDELRTGFTDLIKAFSHYASSFKKPILLVHGDGHYFMIDNPLKWSNGVSFTNFFRLETYGEELVAGIEVSINLDQPNQPFSFRPLPDIK